MAVSARGRSRGRTERWIALARPAGQEPSRRQGGRDPERRRHVQDALRRPSWTGRARPPRSGSHRPVGRGRGGRLHPRRGLARRPPDSRGQKERRRILDSGDGRAPAAARVSQGKPGRDRRRKAVGDAGIRPRSAERSRSRRSPELSDDAARTGGEVTEMTEGTVKHRGTEERRRNRKNKPNDFSVCNSVTPFLRVIPLAPWPPCSRYKEDAMRASRLLGLAVLIAAAITPPISAQQGAPPLVTFDDLRSGLQDTSRWITYSGNYASHRHSPLTQITPQNVSRMTPQWAFQTETLGKFEATPLVFDGVVYITGPEDTGWAIDARTGRQIWRYRRDVPAGIIACCGRVNRGFAMLGDRLFKATLDARVVALSMKSGAVLWEAVMEDFKNGYGSTAAPLAVRDNVIVGMTGGEYGVRGFIDAYDARSGKRVWRFYTTAGPDDPGHKTWRGMDAKAWEHGGGAKWTTGSFDPG